MQNISVRTELGRLIRAAFMASPSTVLVDCDWSQIEMRLGAHYSQDANLVRIFRENKDPHYETAKFIFDTETPDRLSQRQPARNVNFGVFYGLSETGLYDLIAITYATAELPIPDWMTVAWCKEFIERWFSLYPNVRGYLQQQHDRAFKYEQVWTLFGRVRRIPEVRSTHDRIIQAGLRQAGNHPIQGTCADMMRLALAEVQHWIETEIRPAGIWCQPLLTVHDEGIWEVEEEYGEMFRDGVTEIFSNVLTDKDTGVDYCRVPVKAEGKVMRVWEK